MQRINNQRFFLFLILSPIVICLIGFFISRKPTIHLVTDKQFKIITFTDEYEQGGNSTNSIRFQGDTIYYSYVLNNKYRYPYTGFTILLKEYGYIDLRGYTLSFTVKSKEKTRIPIRNTLFLEHFTKVNDPNTFMFLIKRLGVDPGIRNFSMRVEDINEIPDWWYSNNNLAENDVPDYSYKYTQDISFFSDPSAPLGKECSFVIYDLSLSYNYIPYLKYSSYLLLTYYILLFIIKLSLRSKPKMLLMPIEMLKVPQNNNEPLNKVLNYIGLHYMHAELKIKDVAQDVGISEAQVSELLKQYCSLGFKQYLNQVRLHEAKRLLKESDLQISEIAFKVGYNNISHFNRIFKELVGEAPSSFKEKIK